MTRSHVMKTDDSAVQEARHTSTKTIYSVGTSNRTLDDFGQLLAHFGIEVLVDVRRFPTSRFVHFKKEHLQAFCLRQGITYRWMGDLLGGFRAVSYEEYLQTDEFKKGLGRLEAMARRSVTTFCCAERLPSKCHRQFITRRLELRGWSVIHLIDKDTTWISDQLNLF